MRVEYEKSDVYEVRDIDAKGNDKPGRRVVFADLESAQRFATCVKTVAVRVVQVETVATVTEVKRIEKTADD